MSDYDSGDVDLSKIWTCKLKEIVEDLLRERLEPAVAEIAQWKAVAAGYCDQLAESKAQLLKMEAAQCSVTNLIQGRINLLDTEKDAEIARLKELVRFCWQLNDENYALLTETKKAEILAIVLEMEAK